MKKDLSKIIEEELSLLESGDEEGLYNLRKKRKVFNPLDRVLHTKSKLKQWIEMMGKDTIQRMSYDNREENSKLFGLTLSEFDRAVESYVSHSRFRVNS